MQVREAKDFLVQQTAEQALLEGIPLSDLEKRMMYFTESEDAVEDPVVLNDEFEAKYSVDAYETKISALLRHAHSRLQTDQSAIESWNASIRELERGDHYLLVLLSHAGPSNASKLATRTILFLLVGAMLLVVLFVAFSYFDNGGGRYWKPASGVHAAMPVWMRPAILASLLAIYLYFGVLPAFRMKHSSGFKWFRERFARRAPKDTRTSSSLKPR